MNLNGSTLRRWGTTADIHSGSQRLVCANPRLVQPVSGASWAASAALRMFKSHVGHPLPLGYVLCACSLKESMQSPSYHKEVPKESEKYKQAQEKQAPLVLNKISRRLLNWVLKSLEYGVWCHIRRCSALSWDAMRVLGTSKLFSKTDSLPNGPRHFRI